MASTTKSRRTGHRFIDIDYGPEEVGQRARWCLKVDGALVATAPVGDWRKPPFALTEGLAFRPQYHSAESQMEGQPDSWVYRPTRRRDLFWPAMMLAGVLLAASVRWPFLLGAALTILVVAALRETRP